MRTRRLLPLILFLEATIGICAARALPAATLMDMDIVLIRQSDHDLLLCRPWLEGPAEGHWLWAIPGDAHIRMLPQIPIDALRWAVWEGIKPLSEVNRSHLETLCGKEIFFDRRPVACQLIGTYATPADLLAGSRQAHVVLSAREQADAQSLFQDHQQVVLLQYEEGEPGSPGHLWTDQRRPLPAFAVERSSFWRELPVHQPGRTRGCLGTFVMVSEVPLVPSPADPGAWSTGIFSLGRRPALQAALTTVAPGVSGDAAVVVASVNHCDDTVSLSPTPWDPPRDLIGPHAQVAAAWCGTHPSATHAAALRSVLADTTSTGDAFAFAIWAWGKQNTLDRDSVLKPWLHSGDALCRSEAWAALATRDNIHVDLEILADTAQSGRPWHRMINLAGWRLTNTATLADTAALKNIADQDGGWMEWMTQKRHTPAKSWNDPRVFGDTELTPGQWAVVTLARLGDARAIGCLIDALILSAGTSLLESSTSRRQHVHLDTGAWNITQILESHKIKEIWPTLYQLLLALRQTPEFCDSLLSLALNNGALPGEAVSVLLSRMTRWTSEDQEQGFHACMAAMDLVGAPPLHHPLARLRWLQTSAGMAYLMVQQGKDRQVLQMMHDTTNPDLHTELLTALALTSKEDIAAEVEDLLLNIWQPLLASVTDEEIASRVEKPNWPQEVLRDLVPVHQLRIMASYLSGIKTGMAVRDRVAAQPNLNPLLAAYLEACRNQSLNRNRYHTVDNKDLWPARWPEGAPRQ